MRTPLTPAAAAGLLRRGAVVAYPTEAVWGLGCDPDDEAAVARLLAIKQRPVDKGLILVAADFDTLRPWLDLAALPAARLVEVLRGWPGAHTWVMPAAARAPRWITGTHDGIAVRVSAHPDVAALCRAFGGALVSTSANRAGMPPARSRAQLDPGLVAEVDGVLAGQTGGLEQPTPIRVAADGRVLRS